MTFIVHTSRQKRKFRYTRRGTGHFVTLTENFMDLMFISGHIWILLSKLSMYSLNDTTHQWFQSYFEDCTQMCPIDGFLSSSFCNLSCGVPQGSILTPNGLSSCQPRMHVDDTHLTYASDNIRSIFKEVLART